MDHIFGLKKDKFFCRVCFPQSYVQCHLSSCTIYGERRLKHFMNIFWYNSIPVLRNGIRNTVFYSVTNRKPVIFLKCDGSIWDLGGKFRVKRYICFELFEVWVLNFSLKEETMTNIHTQKIAEHVIVFYTQGTCFGDTLILF